MANEYYDLVLNLWNRANNNKSFGPDSFKRALNNENPLFAGIAANDSKDLINFLLEKFHQELNQVDGSGTSDDGNLNCQNQFNEQTMLNLFFKDFQNKFKSIISDLFYGTIETKSQCLNCRLTKYNFQVCSFLGFPLQEVNKYCCSRGKRLLFNYDGTNPDVDLYECFDYYMKVDRMSGENQMYCNVCKGLYMMLIILQTFILLQII